MLDAVNQFKLGRMQKRDREEGNKYGSHKAEVWASDRLMVLVLNEGLLGLSAGGFAFRRTKSIGISCGSGSGKLTKISDHSAIIGLTLFFSPFVRHIILFCVSAAISIARLASLSMRSLVHLDEYSDKSVHHRFQPYILGMLIGRGSFFCLHGSCISEGSSKRERQERMIGSGGCNTFTILLKALGRWLESCCNVPPLCSTLNKFVIFLPAEYFLVLLICVDDLQNIS